MLSESIIKRLRKRLFVRLRIYFGERAACLFVSRAHLGKQMTYEFLVIPACALLNRVRGTDWLKRIGLPGHGRLYVSPIIAGLAYLIGSSPWIGLVYFVWSLFPWGRWQDLGRLPEGFGREGIEPDAFEKIINALSFGSDHVALLLRHSLALPVAYFLWPWGLLFPPLAVLSYELGWRVTPKAPILTAELLTGALWGVMIYLGCAL